VTLSIYELCKRNTTLLDEDIRAIEELAGHLQMFADISQADVFIDCPLPDKTKALVVAQAHPSTAPSLYKTSVVGQLAYAMNEPAVLFCLLSGQPVLGSRGISQEQIAMQQNVIPIRGSQGKTIGALIMEQDISAKVEQEKNVELLMETTEQLSQTLLHLAIADGTVPSLMHEGIVLFDKRYRVNFTNARAMDLLNHIGYAGPVKGAPIGRLFPGIISEETVQQSGGMLCEEIQYGSRCIEVKLVSLIREHKAVGGLMLLRDVTDLKEKEKQLMIKSAVIKEIHHRVKNNLQTVSSLLRLQMRRTQSDEAKKVFHDSINRINSIAVIHEILAYDGLDVIDFKEVIERIVKINLSSMVKPGLSIGFTLNAEPLYIAPDRATTLALVTNELIQNCVLHAFPERTHGHIAVSLKEIGGFVHLNVVDDGVGIDSVQVPSKTNLGMKIVETLVQEDLGGKLTMTAAGRGTDIRITFPLGKESRP
jgi:two-component sensor histidine kinase